jgi:hypothetical protein
VPNRSPNWPEPPGNCERTAFLAPSLDRLRDAVEAVEPVSRAVTLNAEHELYVIPCEGGHSCLGFDVMMTRYARLNDWLQKEGIAGDDLSPEARGTLAAYAAYNALMQRAASYCHRNNLRCPCELTPQLVGLEGKRVEVIDQYGKRRRFQVGKSTGWMPCHLEIARRDSSGGPAVFGAPFQSVLVVA